MLVPQSKREAKEMLGQIGMALTYEEGYHPREAAILMLDDPNLRELFILGGYANEDGTLSYSDQTLEIWAAKANERRLYGDKRSVSNMLFTRQIVEHLRVQQKLRDAILVDGKLHHATRYAEVSKLVASMMPGFLQSDGQSSNNVTVTLTDERKKQIGLAREDALAMVESFEDRLINGEIVGLTDDD